MRFFLRRNGSISRIMADDEHTAAAGQNDTQAQPAAETDSGNQVSPQNTSPTPIVATEITPQSPVQTDTRRTSMSSRGADNMQASQPSLQSGTGESGERQQSERPRLTERESQRRNRPQVARLDYGTLTLQGRDEMEVTNEARINAQRDQHARGLATTPFCACTADPTATGRAETDSFVCTTSRRGLLGGRRRGRGG